MSDERDTREFLFFRGKHICTETDRKRLVVYASWPKLAILELLSTWGGHDGYTTVGRRRCTRTVGCLQGIVTVGRQDGRVDGRG